MSKSSKGQVSSSEQLLTPLSFGELFKHWNSIKPRAVSVLFQLKLFKNFKFQLDDEAENGETSEMEGDESSSSSPRSTSSNSDITIECDEIHDPHDDKNNMDMTEITENDEEEMSAL